METLVGSRLRLNMQGGGTVLLDAQATTHSEELEGSLAVTVAGEDSDVVHIVLLLPNGQALDAPDSITGTRSRGTSSLLASTAQIQFAVAQQAPVVRDHRGQPKVLPPPKPTPPNQNVPQPIARDHRTQPGIFTPPQTSPSPSRQPPPQGDVPGMTGPVTDALDQRPTTVAPDDRYVAPNPSLTMIANAIKTQYKSLTTVLVIPQGLRLATPVEISVQYLSPASPQQTITQTYIVETGNRLVRQDLEGDGKPRRQFMNITLTERLANGAGAQFTMNWQVDLDPLYDVRIEALQFKLIDDFDRFRNSEIQGGGYCLIRRPGESPSVRVVASRLTR